MKKVKKGESETKIVYLLLGLMVVVITLAVLYFFNIPEKLLPLLPYFNDSSSPEKEIIYEEIPLDQRCYISCAPFGECKEMGKQEEDEVSIINVKCPINEVCYVKRSQTKIEEGELKIDSFVFNGLNLLDFNDDEKLNVEYEGNILSFNIKYPDKDFCYRLRTNMKSLSQTGDELNKNNIGWDFTYGQRFIELLAWDPNDRNIFVTKRISLPSYPEFKLIDNSKFKESLYKLSNIGDYFIVEIAKDDLLKDLLEEDGPYTFIVSYESKDKENRLLSISLSNHVLDCYSDSIIFEIITLKQGEDYKLISESKVYDSLSETVYEYCGK